MPSRIRILFAVVLATLAVGVSAATPPTAAEARQSLVGRWQGKLEYRDYQADRWFGLPVKVEIRDGGDGATLIRTADFDDGPEAGIVRITTVSLIAANGMEDTSATFRKGRAVELSTAKATIAPGSTNSANWTMVETVIGSDDDRPATVRLTTTRTNGKVVTLKEVDFRDDPATVWLVRNRTTLERLP
ncbi:MAG: hypothetical protein ABIS38_05410 [Sphingomicrobium sp.]